MPSFIHHHAVPRLTFFYETQKQMLVRMFNLLFFYKMKVNDNAFELQTLQFFFFFIFK